MKYVPILALHWTKSSIMRKMNGSTTCCSLGLIYQSNKVWWQTARRSVFDIQYTKRNSNTDKYQFSMSCLTEVMVFTLLLDCHNDGSVVQITPVTCMWFHHAE